MEQLQFYMHRLKTMETKTNGDPKKIKIESFILTHIWSLFHEALF